MNLGSKIPVPEVDELRIARMERRIAEEVAGLETPVRSARVRYAKVLVGLVAAAGVILAIALNLRGAQGVSGGEATSLPTHLATGPGQSDRLQLGDAVVLIEENTSIGIQRFSDGRTRIVLESGSVHCEVEPRENRPTFQVQAGDVEVTVVGTAFDVGRDRTVEVSVERGIVRVATSHETLRLHAGESWQGSADATTPLASLVPGPLEGKEAVRDAGPETTQNSGTSVATTKPRGKRRHTPSGREKPATPVKLRDVLKGAKPIRPVVQPSHGAKASELMKIAARDPKKAIVELGALAAKATGHEASFALYSRAYLLFFKAGERRLVVQAAKQYERRFPKGREAEDMLWLRVRASCDSETYSSACRAAAHTYRRRYPRGVFDALAARIIRSK